MIKRVIIFLMFMALQAHGAKISIQGLCSSKSLASGYIPQNSAKTVSEISYRFFSNEGISAQGSKHNIDKIWSQPEDRLRQFQHGQHSYYFGWCYAVNGTVSDKTINQQQVKDSDHIQWFLGYMNYANGSWNTQCKPAYTLSFNPLCQKRALSQNSINQKETDEFHFSDQIIVSWASKVERFIPGQNLTANFANTDKALGAVNGDASETLSLGAGGEITLSFNGLIFDGPGADFVVFENAFIPEFLELAYIEVSSDGKNFVRFPSKVQDQRPLGPYGLSTPESIQGLAGKHSSSLGQGFDLGELQQLELVVQGLVDLNSIKFIKIIDIIGDGRSFDSYGEAIYDPFPTQGSAGFDLAGVGAIHFK